MKQLIFLIVIAAIVLFAYGFIHRDFINSPDAAIYADIARHIKEEARPVSSFAMSDYFAYLRADDSAFFKTQYPLFFPLVLALGFLILGSSDLTVVIVSSFFFLANIPLIYFLTRRFFGTGRALLAGVFYIFSPAMVNAAVSGMTETLFAFQVSAIFWLLSFKKIFLMFLTGVVMATAVLTRYQGQLLAVVVIFAVLVMFEKQKLRAILATTGGFLLGILVVETVFPGTISHYIDARQYLSDIALTWGSGYSLENKIFFNLYRLLKEGIFFAGPLVSIFFYLSFLRKDSALVWKLKSIFVLTLILFFASFLIYIFDMRFIWPLLPVAFIFAADALVKVVGRNKLVLVFFLIILIVNFVTSNANGTYLARVADDNFGKVTIHRIVADIAKDQIGTDLTVASDEAAHLAWYGGYKTVMLPNSAADLVTLDQKYQRIDALLVTDYPQGEWKAGWVDLVNIPHELENWRLVYQFKIAPEENFYDYPVRGLIYSERKEP